MNLQFATPLVLLLLLAVPPVLVWELRRAGRKPALLLSSASGAKAGRRTWRVRLRWAPTFLRTGALLLLVIALARPQSGRADSLVPQDGIDIALVLDTSSSMRTAMPDEESGLDVAQRVLRDFAAGRERDRLGLVIFRQRSLVLSPLTTDYSAFQALLARTGEFDLPDGTAIGLAVTDAANLLRDSKAKSRIVIMVTDGDNNRPEVPPLVGARAAGALGVRVYTVGIPGVDLNAGAGQATRTNVNEALLRSMADATDGRFFRASDPDALAQVYDTIADLERSRVGPERFAAFDELAPYFMVGALALIAAEVALVAFVLRRLP